MPTGSFAGKLCSVSCYLRRGIGRGTGGGERGGDGDDLLVRVLGLLPAARSKPQVLGDHFVELDRMQSLHAPDLCKLSGTLGFEVGVVVHGYLAGSGVFSPG